jgi:hypothetical protein
MVLVMLFLGGCKPSNETSADNTDEIGGEDLSVDSSSVSKISPLLKKETLNDNSDSYLLLDKIDLDSKRNLIVADNSDKSIFKFSLNDNKKLFTFGRKGSGPGEFRYIKLLRNDSKRGIIIGDDLLKKCSIFDQNGLLRSTISFYELIDDIIFMNDSILIYSNYVSEKDYKPVKIYSTKTERIITSLGRILEPQKDFFELITKNKSKEGVLKETFSYSSLTGLIYIEQENKLILSQTHPYALWIIDLNTQKYFRFNVKVPFSTYNNLKVEILNDGRMARTIQKSGKQVHPIIYNKKIVSLITDSTNQKMYLDTYKLNGDFIRRFSIPSLPLDLWIADFVIDDRNILYILVRDKNWVSWIERFKIDSRVFN